MPAVWHNNSVSDFGAIASPATMVLPSNTVAGRQIVVILYHSYLGCPPSLTDSQGNTYSQHSANPLDATGYLWVFTAVASQSAACTITATYACGNIREYYAAEVSGLDTSSIFDVEAIGTDTGTPYGVGVTTTRDGALVLTMYNKEGGDPGATSIDSPFTLDDNTVTHVTAYAIQTSAGAITPALNGPTGNIVCATVAFKATVAETNPSGGLADLTYNVHKKKRVLGLRSGLAYAQAPIGAPAATFAKVKKHALGKLTRPELKVLIKKGKKSSFSLWIPVRPPASILHLKSLVGNSINAGVLSALKNADGGSIGDLIRGIGYWLRRRRR
jgi:hypothetical protein